MIRRKLKNVIKNYSECEILVREATSNETWGPSNSILSKIAELSHDEANLLLIMPLIWRRLKDKGRCWRHVYKSLLLTIFLVTRGNINIAEYCRRNIHFIESLESFTYMEGNIDVGSRIRKRVTELTALLKDNDFLKIERQKAMITDMRFSKDMVSQGSNVPIKYGNGVNSLSQGPSTGSFISNSDNKETAKQDYPIPTSTVEEDIQLQIALAESKEEAERLQQTEEIKELTDKYKVNLAIEKNLKENCFENEFEVELWNEKVTVIESVNDPWSPEPEKRICETEPKFDCAPWSQNIASNESLWSHSTKPLSLDPWSTNECLKGDCFSSNDGVLSADPWPNVVNPENPWSDVNVEYSNSQIELNANMTYNPWSHNPILSNPIQRKVINNSRDGSVTEFLADHNHLVNIESLLSLDSLKQKQNQNNPFLTDFSSKSYNPFLVTNDIPEDINTNCPQEIDNGPSQWALSESNNPSLEFKSVNYNPFLT